MNMASLLPPLVVFLLASSDIFITDSFASHFDKNMEIAIW
jgi:hypothetical protein